MSSTVFPPLSIEPPFTSPTPPEPLLTLVAGGAVHPHPRAAASPGSQHHLLLTVPHGSLHKRLVTILPGRPRASQTRHIPAGLGSLPSTCPSTAGPPQSPGPQPSRVPGGSLGSSQLLPVAHLCLPHRRLGSRPHWVSPPCSALDPTACCPHSSRKDRVKTQVITRKN